MLQAIIAYGLHRKIEIVVKVCRCREGTAKFAETAGEKDHHLQKVLQKHVENSRAIRWHSENYMKKENIQFVCSYGTIPYLGTFLTDLTMIDTAIPDVVNDGLINFDKRRKEFEVLAQVQNQCRLEG